MWVPRAGDGAGLSGIAFWFLTRTFVFLLKFLTPRGWCQARCWDGEGWGRMGPSCTTSWGAKAPPLPFGGPVIRTVFLVTPCCWGPCRGSSAECHSGNRSALAVAACRGARGGCIIPAPMGNLEVSTGVTGTVWLWAGTGSRCG